MADGMLKVWHHVPEGFLHCQTQNLKQLLGGPALIHLQGKRQPALFVSVLLHGNESGGFYAIQHLLRRYLATGLPRAISIFIGNVYAAEQDVRCLDGQPDYNRIWPGNHKMVGREVTMMQEVTAIMRQRGVFASIDVHNTSGKNPDYACLHVIAEDELCLTSLFSEIIIYFTYPQGVQSIAFSDFCPAIIIECGQKDQLHSLEHVVRYLDTCLHMKEFQKSIVKDKNHPLYHPVATVKIPNHVRFGFGKTDVDITFIDNLDALNFRELESGTVLGNVSADDGLYLDVRDELGNDVYHRYFLIRNGQLQTKTNIMPTLLTRDRKIIQQDCLCYLMQPKSCI